MLGGFGSVPGRGTAPHTATSHVTHRGARSPRQLPAGRPRCSASSHCVRVLCPSVSVPPCQCELTVLPLCVSPTASVGGRRSLATCVSLENCLHFVLAFFAGLFVFRGGCPGHWTPPSGRPRLFHGCYYFTCRLFNFAEGHLLFCCLCFWCQKSLLPSPRSRRVSCYVFFSKSFTALAFSFRSLFRFELLSACGSNFILLHAGIQGSQRHVLRRLFLPHQMALAPVTESHLTADTWFYFWTLFYTIPLCGCSYAVTTPF